MFDTGNPFGTIVVMVFALLLIFFAAHYSTKFLARKSQGLAKGKYMQLKDNMYVSRDKHIMMLEVSGRYYIVGVTNQAFTLIGSLDEADLAPLSDGKKEAAGQSPAGKTFFDRAIRFVKKASEAPQELQRRQQQERAANRAKPSPHPPAAAGKPARRATGAKSEQDERDEIEMILHSIQQRKGRLMGRGDKDEQP